MERFFRLSQAQATDELHDESHQKKHLAAVKTRRSMLRNLSAWGKLPNHCTGQFWDNYHQIPGFREKHLLVDISAALRRIIYDAGFSRL